MSLKSVLSLLSLATAQLAVNVYPGSSENNNNDLSKREAQVDVHNAALFYYAQLQIGTPPQNVTALIDTGSSDLWVPQDGAIGCDTGGKPHLSKGSDKCHDESIFFDQQKSSTFNRNQTDFAITYRDGSVAQGYWGTDVVDLNGATADNVSLAVVQSANTTMGILGLGLPGLESTVNEIIDGQPMGCYENLPVHLKNLGITTSHSYSLSLGAHNQTMGSLIFGGIDHASYSGQLHKVPIVRTLETNFPTTTSVMLHGISIGNRSLLSCSLPVLLDSGSSINYLPGPFVEAIGQAFNASYSNDVGAFILPCNSDTTLQLDFSGINITVDSGQNIGLVNQTNQQLYNDGVAMCALPFLPSDSSFIIGVTSIRSMYLSFDYDNYEVAIAQYKEGNSPQVEQIDNGIPGAVPAPSYNATSSTTAFSVATTVTKVAGIKDAISLTSLYQLAETDPATMQSSTGSPTGLSSASNHASHTHELLNPIKWVILLALNLS